MDFIYIIVHTYTYVCICATIVIKRISLESGGMKGVGGRKAGRSDVTQFHFKIF